VVTTTVIRLQFYSAMMTFVNNNNNNNNNNKNCHYETQANRRLSQRRTWQLDRNSPYNGAVFSAISKILSVRSELRK